jgi:hypothetical protein
MITALGADGAIANEVVKLLSARKQRFRVVARSPPLVPVATEMLSADLSDKDQTIRRRGELEHRLSSRWSQIRSQALDGNVAANYRQHH